MCEKHPNYKQKFKPVSNCVDCWKEWATKLQEENKQLVKDNVMYRAKLERFKRALNEAMYG